MAETPVSLGSDDAIEIIKKAKMILVQYSGGKDSTVALNWAVPLARKYDIPIVAGLIDHVECVPRNERNARNPTS